MNNNGMRFSPFTQNNKNIILSSQQQPQPQQQLRKSATPTKMATLKTVKSNETLTPISYSDTDDDERDFFDEEDVSELSNSNENLSKEERYVLSHVRAEPQGQENLSGNVTPVNEPQNINIFEKVSQNSPTKLRYSTNNSSNDFSSQNGSNRNSLILQQQQQQHSNRNSLIKDVQQSPSNRSSLDVSQSSYNTLIIHDDNQSLFSAPVNPNVINKQDYYINSSPSPPTYVMKKDKSSSRSRSFGNGSPFTATNPEMMVPTAENEQYLNQSFVLKHLAKEVKIPKSSNNNSVSNNESTRDSGVSENNSSNNNWLFSTSSNESGSASAVSTNSRNKSKSQPDLSIYVRNVVENNEASNSTTTTLNFNDFEQLELENNKLRQQLNDSLMKVAKSQKLEQEVTNIYRVHEELVQSCERRERLERTARGRLQTDCRRLQELNRALREQVELLQNQLLTTQQQQQLATGGRTQQDLLISQLIQQNKELVDANKRQYIEIQAQSATLEEQRVHINVLDNALKRLEEECRQKQLQVAQLQRALQINERREKLRLEFDNDLSKEINRMNVITSADQANNLKWKDYPMRLEAECSKLEQQNLQVAQAEADRINQEKLRFLEDPHAAQRKVSDLQTRLKLVENRLAEKDAIIRALQGQKLYSGASSGSYSLLTNNDCYATSASSIVSSTATTPLIYNTSNFDNLIAQQQNSSAGTSSNPNASYDLLGAPTAASILDYSGLYHHQNYGQKLSPQSSAATSNLLNQVSSSGGVINVGMSPSPNTSCSSSSTAMLPSQQQQSNSSSSANSNYFDQQSLDQQRKTIDDQLKQLDGQLLSKICCFPRPSLTSKKAALLGDEMSVLTTNNSEAFLQNLVERHHYTRENTPSNGSSTKEDIVLLEKQGRCSQKLRSSNAMGNLAQVSNMVKNQNTTDISNISNTNSKLPKIVLPPRKERNSSAPPSALPRPPTRTLKPPRKIEYGRLSETESNKSTETSERNKNEYELKTSSLKRHQSPISSSSGTKNFLNIKNELQLALNGKGNTKNYGAIKTENSTPGITKIYYSNKPDYLSTKNYQRFDSSSTPPSPSSSDSMKRPFATPPTTSSSGKKISFIRASSAVQNQKASSRDSLNSISSGSNSNSNSRSSPVIHGKMEQAMMTSQVNRSRTRTPPKYLPLQVEINNNSKLNYSPTKLPSSSVLHAAHIQQAPSLPPKPNSASHLRGTSTGRSGSNGENKYRIQF